MSVQVPLFEKGDKKASKVAAKVEQIVGAGFDVAKFVENFEVLVDADLGIEHLRGLIIDLAIRGRLGTQNKGDTSATELVERARATLGSVRRRRTIELPPPALELPTNWAWCEPQDLGEVSPRNDAPDELSVGFVPMTHVPLDYRQPVVAETRPWKDIKKGYTHLANRDIAVAKITPCFQNGKSCVMAGLPNGIGAGTTELLVLRPVPGVVEPHYLLLFFKSPDFIVRGTSLMTGTAGQQRVPVEYFAAVPLPLPPLAEQKRIVAKVDQLMALCDELEAKQTRKRETGARLTKSALDALTSAEGPDEFDAAWTRVVENFDVLIDRAEKVGELRLTIMDVASHGRLVRQHETDPPATVAIATKRREIERCVGTLELPDDRGTLPPGWTWELLGNLGADAENPVQTGPFGAQLHRSDFVSEGVPVIAVGNLTGTGFTTDGLYFVTRTKAESLSRYDIHAGDLLFARSGATTGKVCVAPHFVKDWRMTGHILRVRLDPHLILPELVVYWLWGSAVVRSQIMGNIRGGTRPGYNTSLLKSIVVPVPPLAEQGRILAKIAHLMEVCDQLEERLRNVEDRASKLVEAVVRELVA